MWFRTGTSRAFLPGRQAKVALARCLADKDVIVTNFEFALHVFQPMA
jgi:hypothetical protein